MGLINSYLRFNGNCEPAMMFYKECFGGELAMSRIKETPIASQMPAEMQDHIMHSSLSNGNLTLLASDLSGPEGVTHGNSVALCYVAGNAEEANICFAKLAAGGKVDEPLSEMFFGMFGSVTDKFGMTWMIQSNPEPEG